MSSATKPKRRNGALYGLNLLFSLMVLGLGAAVVGVLVLSSTFYSKGPTSEEKTFLVERGSGLGLVAERLELQGLITNRFVFQGMGLILRKQGEIKQGEYRIPAGASMGDVLHEITEGRPIQYAVTVPEGFTSWQVVDVLSKDDQLTGTVAMLPEEGALLPQTYNYDRGADRNAILEQMRKAQAELLAEIWAGRDPDLQLETPEQLVILASVVEKETGIATERPQVAAVFLNRLKKGMRLQSDPTVIYGVTQGQGPLGRGLRKSELEAKTAYNTYQIDGLPKGPIANPGEASMRAVANPAKTEDLYFVAATANPADGHLFAPTYAEHRKNVARYRAAVKAADRANAKAAQDAQSEAAKEELEAEQGEPAEGADPAAPAAPK